MKNMRGKQEGFEALHSNLGGRGRKYLRKSGEVKIQAREAQEAMCIGA